MVRVNGDVMGMEILNKVDAVVTALEQQGELSIAALADAVGEPVSSTYRLVSSLSRIGWITPGSRRGMHRLGLFFMRIGSLVEDIIDVRERSLPYLRQLLEATGQTGYLCIRQDSRAVCIERLEGGDVRSMALRLGASLPLSQGGAPQAILAFLPDGEYESVVEELAATGTGDARRHRIELDRAVARIRELRYAVSDGDVTPGVAAVGAPVFNHRGELAAAISVSGIQAHILGDRREEVIAAALACAAGVSEALGWRGTVVR